MDRPDRSATASPQTTMRKTSFDQGRRPIPNSAATSNGTPPPPPPVPNLRKLSSNSNLSASTVPPPSQVIALAREAMKDALESENQAAETSGLKTGITIDLSRKNLQYLPDEVVDIVKGELERLALSHNQLSSLPARFSECSSLRYLNIRGNQIKEFPMPLCDLFSLEILDLGRNQLRTLPSDIVRLSSLKVLSVPKNQIRELPLCLADMGSLQVLKFEGNPVSFPPRDAMQVQAASPPEGRDGEVTEVAVTAQIKKYLRNYTVNGRVEADSTADESEAEAPRFPLKRAASGRFPVKVNGADLPDIRSPVLGSRAPPIPARSHYRGLSQQNTLRRPSVMPLTIGSVHERLRSNSETLLRSDRADGRSRRMGMVSKKLGTELGTLNEMETNNRFSHYRGLSHGSVMVGTPVNGKGSAVAPEPYPPRPVYVRRLSVLPERRRESKVFDPVIEAAKGVLYSVFQIHPMIQMLMTLTNDGSAKRSSLEIVFYNTNSHVEELEREIQKYDSATGQDEDNANWENEHVHRACQTLVSAYGHVCTLLADNIDTFVDKGDARYIRTLLVLLYNSIMELRVTLGSLFNKASEPRKMDRDVFSGGDTIKPPVREASVPAVVARGGPSRSRNGTVVQRPSSLRVATDMTIPHPHGSERPANYASVTPQSEDSFALTGSRPAAHGFSAEDAQFESVFLSLQKSADIAMRTLPGFHAQLLADLRNMMQRRAPYGLIESWKSLIVMCGNTIRQTETLKNSLATMKLKERGVKSTADFWNQCCDFIASWAELARKIKISYSKMPLPPDTRARLRPIQQSTKKTTNIIMSSPWSQLLRISRTSGSGTSPCGSQTMYSPSPMPLSPQNAALVPPAVAKTGGHSNNTSFAAAFQGNVFDRADALIANPGISMSRSGNGTMYRGHSGFNSLSSISSMSSDGNSTPANGLGSGNAAGASSTPRANGSKAAF